MTTEPTNRAREVLDIVLAEHNFASSAPGTDNDSDRLHAAILTAMEAYRAEGVAEEMERCAGIAEYTGTQVDDYMPAKRCIGIVVDAIRFQPIDTAIRKEPL